MTHKDENKKTTRELFVSVLNEMKFPVLLGVVVGLFLLGTGLAMQYVQRREVLDLVACEAVTLRQANYDNEA